MFEDVPPSLTWFVSGLRYQFMDNPKKRYLVAAREVAKHYIGFDTKEKTTGKFLGFATEGSQFYEAIVKIMMVGETLFALRNCEGFAEFCKRSAGRDFRSLFCELIVARTYLMGGYEVKQVIPSFVRGQDFDLVVIRDGETLNIEVTSTEVAEFSEATVLNTLRKKRTQVPNTHPSVFVYVIPDSWMTFQNTRPDRFEIVAKEFLRSTGRINALTFMCEIKRQFDDSGAYGLVSFGSNSYFSENPNFPWEPKDLIGGAHIDDEMRHRIFETTDETELKKFRDTEFFKWVDLLTT